MECLQSRSSMAAGTHATPAPATSEWRIRKIWGKNRIRVWARAHDLPGPGRHRRAAADGGWRRGSRYISMTTNVASRRCQFYPYISNLLQIRNSVWRNYPFGDPSKSRFSRQYLNT